MECEPEESTNFPQSQPRDVNMTGHERLKVHSGYVIGISVSYECG
jgi:hypothetical protein